MAVPLAARIAAQAMRSAKKDMSKQMAQIQKQVQSEIDKGLKDFGSSLKVDAEVLGMDELKKDLKDVVDNLNEFGSVKVGVPQQGNYPDGTPIKTVGFVHEFGSPKMNIPQRSFLRSTLIENESRYYELIGKGIEKVLQGKASIKDVRNGIAVTFEGDVKDKITDLPLIDTGLLKKSIISETGDS